MARRADRARQALQRADGEPRPRPVPRRHGDAAPVSRRLWLSRPRPRANTGAAAGGWRHRPQTLRRLPLGRNTPAREITRAGVRWKWVVDCGEPQRSAGGEPHPTVGHGRMIEHASGGFRRAAGGLLHSIQAHIGPPYRTPISDPISNPARPLTGGRDRRMVDPAETEENPPVTRIRRGHHVVGHQDRAIKADNGAEPEKERRWVRRLPRAGCAAPSGSSAHARVVTPQRPSSRRPRTPCSPPFPVGAAPSVPIRSQTAARAPARAASLVQSTIVRSRSRVCCFCARSPINTSCRCVTPLSAYAATRSLM